MYFSKIISINYKVNNKCWTKLQIFAIQQAQKEQ